MSARSEAQSTPQHEFSRGQRYYCARCQAEVEVINPSTAAGPSMDLRCCGEPMQPSTGVAVNVNVEA